MPLINGILKAWNSLFQRCILYSSDSYQSLFIPMNYLLEPLFLSCIFLLAILVIPKFLYQML